MTNLSIVTPGAKRIPGHALDSAAQQTGFVLSELKRIWYDARKAGARDAEIEKAFRKACSAVETAAYRCRRAAEQERKA